MTKIEKLIIAAMGFIVALVVLNLVHTSYKIAAAGGIKAILVEAGKIEADKKEGQ